MESNFPGCPWQNVFKKSFLVHNNLFFLKGSYCEDLEWDFRVFCAAKHIRYVDEIIYRYVCNDTVKSLSRTAGTLSKMINKFAIMHTAYKVAKETRASIFSLRAAQIMNMIVIGEYPFLLPKEKKLFIKELNKNKNELAYLYGHSGSVKLRLPAMLLKFSGSLFVSTLLAMDKLMSLLKK